MAASAILLLASLITIPPATAATRSPFSPPAPIAKPAFGCQDVRRAALELSVHAYNLANRATTRTPEGGPFRPRAVECRGDACNVIVKRSSTMLVYEPGHPDADSDGYVMYPSISVSSEFTAVNAAAAELKLLGAQDVCEAHAIVSSTTAMVKYGKAVEAESDTLGFTSDGRLASWSRIGRDGQAYRLQFNSDGTVAAR